MDGMRCSHTTKLPGVIVDMKLAIEDYQWRIASFCQIDEPCVSIKDAQKFITLCLSVPRDIPSYDDMWDKTVEKLSGDFPIHGGRLISANQRERALKEMYEVLSINVALLTSYMISEVVGQCDYVDSYRLDRWVDNHHALFVP